MSDKTEAEEKQRKLDDQFNQDYQDEIEIFTDVELEIFLLEFESRGLAGDGVMQGIAFIAAYGFNGTYGYKLKNCRINFKSDLTGESRRYGPSFAVERGRTPIEIAWFLYRSIEQGILEYDDLIYVLNENMMPDHSSGYHNAFNRRYEDDNDE